MERKPAGGAIRNTERSKEKFLSAVGKILKTKGYAGLKINDIAKVAGVDKKMIYTYFGGLDGLIDEYIRTQDFWSNVHADMASEPIDDGGKAFTKEVFLSQFDYLSKNKEVQKVLLWRLSEERKSLRKLTDEQEENGEVLFSQITDPHFGKHAEKFRAVSAVLVAGMYYLNMYAEHNGSIFSGIDLKTDDGRKAIKDAVSFLIDKTYDGL
ncbi:TetR/AcrR family transcriptional regulator [Paenimyroides baculatum]|uniref:TetR/AcrR family transcriptional regulator n=1 Tax=Paenimyroides baculatum TaxID=2608000 RepID=A0A5M6CV09_9FLAO|nr:TetR/AcrR family transcriptional regulator [Paenimyroides baculatum]KAA5537822.1 TetR/AcrR family transcriptional regulator [Paenimyroides baculatum]